MIEVSRPEDKSIVENVYQSGQSHVFRWWDELEAKEKSALLAQLGTVEYDVVEKLVRQFAHGEEKKTIFKKVEPAPFIPIPKTPTEVKRWKEAKAKGEELLSQGGVAVFTVAGGQGTRLNFPHPKGLYPITPVRNKSFFQLFSERIRALGNRYGKIPPWYIMTSETNYTETEEYFEKEKYFGLNPKDVSFFPQRMIPAVDRDGKFLMESKSRIFMNPNGHGGSLLALSESGALDDMRGRGIQEIFYFQVDNVLVKIADPVFVGYHVLEAAQVSAKMVPKRDPMEKVGVFALLDGAYGVIEYSDLDNEKRFSKDKDGRLLFDAGNIAIHMFSVDFVDQETREGLKLPFHMARKKIPFLDHTGKIAEPTDANGVKFETFVFDAMKDAARAVIQEVPREEDFSPVKNAEGEDSSESARRDMVNLYSQWLREAKISLPEKESFPIEISPLFALDREEFLEKVDPGLKVTGPLYLE